MQFPFFDEVSEPDTSPLRDSDLYIPEGEVELMKARLKKEMFAEITSELECHITRKYCCEQYELPVYLGIDKDTYYPKIATLAELHEDCRYDIHDIQEYEQCYYTNENPENFELKLTDSNSIQRLVDKYCLTDEDLNDPCAGLRTHATMTRRIMVAPTFEDYIPPKEMSCNLELALPKVSSKLYFAGIGRNGHLHAPTAIQRFKRFGIEFVDIETLGDKGKEIIEEINREYGDGYSHRLFIRYDSLKGFLICDCFEITTLNRAKALSSYYIYAANHFADPDKSFYTNDFTSDRNTISLN